MVPACCRPLRRHGLDRSLVYRAFRRLRGDGHLRNVRHDVYRGVSSFGHSPGVFANSGITIDQARKGGFRFRTIAEIAQKRAQLEQEKRDGSDSDIDKKGSEEFIESA